MLVAIALGLAETDPVDDRGMVERVADDGILFAEQRLEQSAISVEARGIEDRVAGAEEAGDGFFQRLVQVLRATDEANGRHAEAVVVERTSRGGDDLRMIGKAEI